MEPKSMKSKSVGAAKGEASPGGESNLGEDAKEKQFKGPGNSKPKTNESGSPGENSMADRGMTSDIAAKLWPKGRKVER